MKHLIFPLLLMSILPLLVVGNQSMNAGEKPVLISPNQINDEPNQIIDSRDGEAYHFVQIGDLLWLTENLRYQADDSECYEGEEANCETYGRLYSFEDSRTACPDGWHLPSPKEWKSLRKVMRSRKADKIIVTEGWEDESFSGATNELGLSILPGGRKDEKGPANQESEFGEQGISSSYWLDDGEYHWHIRWGKSHIHKHGDISRQGRKFYIRCVCEGGN